MAFYNARFPEHISYGSQGGPKFNTTVLILASGFEKRNINWQQVRGEYEAQHGIKTREEMEEIMAFFMAMMGRAHSFRYKDWLDYTIVNGGLVGNGTATVRLSKRYQVVTTAHTFYYDRFITKPIVGTFTGVTVNAVARTEKVTVGSPSSTEFTVDGATGNLTFGTAPGMGDVIEIGYCEFDVHTRFDTDHLNVTQDFWETMSWPSIPLVEIKEQNT